MDWVKEAQQIFNYEKPESFNDAEHCDEHARYNKIFMSHNVETVTIEELAAGCFCFSSAEGMTYYMPAIIEFCLDIKGDYFFIGDLLFHLTDHPPLRPENNRILKVCSNEQRQFLYNFLEYMVDNYSNELEKEYVLKDALKALEIWKP